MKKALLLLIFYIPMLLFGFFCNSVDAIAQNFRDQQDLQWVAVPSHQDWLYRTGEKAQIDVQLLWHGTPASGVEITYGTYYDNLPSQVSPSSKVKTDEKGHARIEMGTLRNPGFMDLRMQCTIEGISQKNHIKVGFGPEHLTPYTKEPKDFDDFWQKALAEQVPLDVTVTPSPEYSNEKVECYLVKFNGGTKQVPHAMYGYVSIPRKEGKFPVLVSPPGAGVKPMNPLKTQFYATEGDIIRLDLEIHGISPALSAEDYKDITRAFGDHQSNGYLASGIQNRDTYYLKKVYPLLVRAVDYLTTLPQWDGRNVLVQGNSQGAALSLALAALDKRVSAIAIAHPALSDMAGYAEKNRTGGYPHFGNKYKEVELTPQVIETLSYFDAVNFARRVTCPVYMTWGYNDNTCAPTTSWIVWNTLTCPKEQYLTPINEHWISTETRYRQMRFLQQHVK